MFETLILIGIALFTTTVLVTLYLWLQAKWRGQTLGSYLDELESTLKEQSKNKWFIHMALTQYPLIHLAQMYGLHMGPSQRYGCTHIRLQGGPIHTQEYSRSCWSLFFAFFVSPVHWEFTFRHCFYLTLVQVSQNIIPIFLMNNACSLLSMLVDVNSQPPKHRSSSVHLRSLSGRHRINHDEQELLPLTSTNL